MNKNKKILTVSIIGGVIILALIIIMISFTDQGNDENATNKNGDQHSNGDPRTDNQRSNGDQHNDSNQLNDTVNPHARIIIDESALTVCLDQMWKQEYCDANGQRMKLEWYDRDGALEDYWLYEYDEHGNVIKSEHYDKDDVFEEYWLGEYDEYGNVIKEEHYDHEGNLIE